MNYNSSQQDATPLFVQSQKENNKDSPWLLTMTEVSKDASINTKRTKRTCNTTENSTLHSPMVAIENDSTVASENFPTIHGFVNLTEIYHVTRPCVSPFVCTHNIPRCMILSLELNTILFFSVFLFFYFLTFRTKRKTETGCYLLVFYKSEFWRRTLFFNTLY